MKKLIVISLLAALPIFFTACGGGEKLYEVTGAVSYQGTPVEKGTISFRSENAKLPPCGATIENGKYKCMVRKGKMTVQITGSRQVQNKKKEDQGLILWEDFIPEKYAKDSTQTVEITGSQTKDFHLE